MSTGGTLLFQPDRLASVAATLSAATDIKTILLDAPLLETMAGVAGVEAVRIFAVDNLRRDLFSLFRGRDGGAQELRFALDESSVAGHTACEARVLRLPNAADKPGLKRIHPALRFDGRWDGTSGRTTRQLLSCPILYEKQVVGVVQLVNRKGGGAFTEEHEDVARRLAAVLARVFHERRRADAPTQEWRTLFDLGKRFHAAPTLEALVFEAEAAAFAVEAERALLFVMDVRQRDLMAIVRRGEKREELRVPPEQSSIPRISARERRTVNIADARDAAELRRVDATLKPDLSWDRSTGLAVRQVLSTPTLFEGNPMGVLVGINKKGGGVFVPRDEETFQEIACLLGTAVFHHRRLSRSEISSKFGLLIDKGFVSEKDVESAAAFAEKNERDVASVLMEHYRIPVAEIALALSSHYHCAFWESRRATIPPELKKRLSPDHLGRKNAWVPVELRNDILLVAIEDPHDESRVREILQANLTPRVAFLVGLRADIRGQIEASFGRAAASAEEQQIRSLLKELGTGERRGSSTGRTEDLQKPIARLADQIITSAWRQGASDIHIEPHGTEEDTVVRLRVDGDCREYVRIDGRYRDALVQVFKLMADLRIDERRRPQDGKMRFLSPKGPIELRIATIPTAGGNEDVVMRILASSKTVALDEMGFSRRNLDEFKKILRQPYGICLVVGPTGSGKTTTLHAGLGFINTVDVKIWTAEDPVEITQRGLRQVQVAPKITPPFTFADAMRAFVRADPDVIMVGEMRDAETAGVAIEASLTGHLVLSTLHTNSAPETITRLLDLGIDPFSFADALLGVLAQRLVRTLCTNCKEPLVPSQEEFDELRQNYGLAWWDRSGVRYSPDLRLYRPRGCPECGNSGYRGRTGIHELLVASDSIKRLIQRRAPIEEIRQQAMTEGMTTMLQDGIDKVFKGVMDFEQVRSVCMR